MHAFRRIALATVLCGFAVASFPSRAHAEPTAAELVAARQLFAEGQELEKKKDYAAALERFRKVATIKSTAIVRYHEGYCAEKIGHYIDALDAYAKAQLEGEGDPKQKEAVAAARKAQESLRPRTPKVRVKVSGLAQKGKYELRIDGTRISDALIDLPVPVDPGKHLVEVTGDGFTADSQEVTVAEKETKEVTVEAKTKGEGTTEPPKKDEPKKTEPKKEEPPKEEPKKEEPKKEEPKKNGKPQGVSTFGLVFGLSIGNVQPGGKLMGVSTGNSLFAGDSSDQLQWIGGGVSLEVNAGLRIIAPLAIYVFGEYGALGKSGNTKPSEDFTASTSLIGVGASYLSHPRSPFSFYADLSIGGRSTRFDDGTTGVKCSFSSVDPRLKLGGAFRPLPTVTVLAYVWGSFGSYGSFKYEDRDHPNANVDGQIDQTASHVFFGAAVGGTYDLKL